MDYKWVRLDMNLYHVRGNSAYNITFVNSGRLDADFYKYAQNLYEAAETVIHYLVEEALKTMI